MRNKIYQLILFLVILCSTLKIFAQETKPPESTPTIYNAVIVVGSEFKYQVIVKTMLTVMPTSYKLVNFPEGMAIDEKTGLIKWIPKIKGEFSAEAEAYLSTTKLGSVILKLRVVDVLGSVTGVITYAEKSVLYGMITLFKKNVSASGKAEYIAYYYGNTETDGSYKITGVEPGTYVVLASAKEMDPTVRYQPTYYLNATTIESATPINIVDANPVKVDIGLMTQIITTVYSAAIKVNEDFSYQVDIKTAFAANSISYKLTGPAGMKIDEKSGLVTWRPGSKGEFSAEAAVYSGTTKVGSATLKLKVVDFVGAITGSVLTDDGRVLPNVYVSLTKKVTVNGKDSYENSLSTVSNTTGVFNFSSVEGGTYVVYAQPKPISSDLSGQYMPAYFVDAQTIESATKIDIKDAVPFTANFKLHKIITVTTFNYAAVLTLNTEFKYQITVKLPADATNITYNLSSNKQPGMAVDLKGLFTWTPTTKGEFTSEIGVLSNNVKFAVVVLKLKVASFFTTISGSVKSDDTTPLPIQNVLVTLLKKITTKERGDTYVATASVLTDATGAYKLLNVEEGIYILYAKPSYEKMLTTNATSVMYLPAYYTDAQSIEKATLVPVDNSSAITANFTLHKYVKPEPVKATISGTVKDIKGTPIAGARIIVTATKPATGISFSTEPVNMLINQDASIGCYADIASDTKTDASGKYTVSLIAGSSYIASATAEGFLQQFYKDKTNILVADKILLNGSVTGIDFQLTPTPVAKAVVSGKVVDGDKVGVMAKVILFPATNATPVISNDKGVRSVATNDKGEFVIEKIPNGKYYLQVVPMKNYLPAYYKQDDCGVKEAKLADAITVQNDVNVGDLVVCVKKVLATGGGKISGRINNSNGEGISGAIVIAESEDGNECAFAISEADGTFEIANLGIGKYTITCDKVGYASNVSNNSMIDYAKDLFNSSVNIVLNGATITGIENRLITPVNFALNQNYPNPFNPSTVISWQIVESSHVILKVYDMLGREVATLVDEFKQPGVYNSTFSTQHSQLSSGVYYYTLKTGNIMQTKKMLLMK